MINNSVYLLSKFYEWMQLDLGDNSFEQPRGEVQSGLLTETI